MSQPNTAKTPVSFGLRDAGPAYWTAAQVAHRIGVTERTLREWVRRGTWPPPTVFSRKTKRWHSDVVNATLNAK